MRHAIYRASKESLNQLRNVPETQQAFTLPSIAAAATPDEGWTLRTAIVVGFAYHVNALCARMNAHSRTWRFWAQASDPRGLLLAAFRLRSADVLISFAGPAPHPILTAAARAFNVPIIVIWAGSDVTRLLEEPGSLSQAKRAEFLHVAVAPWLVEELRRAGVAATYVPTIGVAPASAPMPQHEFNILTYLPEPRRDFYGRMHAYEVARRMPSATLFVVGVGDADRGAPSNVKFLGWRPDILPILDGSVALLRVPDHDGMSLIVLEALARGRYVLWNHHLPGVSHVASPDDSIGFLETLRAHQGAGMLTANAAGIEFTAKHYEEESVAHGFGRFLNATIAPRSKKDPVRKRIAIFGLDLFSSDVARRANKSLTGWRAQVLQFENRYEILESLFELARSKALYILGAPALGRSVTLVTRLLRKPKVMHWVGTDIEVARRRPDILKPLLNPRVVHLTEVEWEAEELRALGVNAQIVPLPPRLTTLAAIPPLPRKFTLLIYLPSKRSEFYGSREARAVITALKEEPIKFLIVGGGQVDIPADADVENLGWCYTLEDVYARTSALMRFTVRDGLSLMVLEALALGRHVLWTKNFPFVKHVSSAGDTREALVGLLEQHKKGGLKAQSEAAEFIRSTYDPALCMNRLIEAWEEASRRR